MKIQATLTALVLAASISCDGLEQHASNTASPASDPYVDVLKKQKDAVVQFYKPMHVEQGDWLGTQKEPGETFEEYIASNPTLPTNERRTIYIQPIGRFTNEQKRVVQLTADYMKAFYDLPVKLNAELPIGKVPEDKQRAIGRDSEHRQIRTNYFLKDVLPKLLPHDAAALIAFTNVDLYPEETWHFVFGQATLEERVGIWSLYRLLGVNERKRKPELLLQRTLKIAMHETGHMFSMKHCTKYECLMSGTNHLAETDRRPLDNCPECMAKIAWAMKYEPVERYNNLAAFWRGNGNRKEEERMMEMAAAASNVRK
jgi:archaemetzincin